MTAVVAVGNGKGGVGKTTLGVGVGAELALRGHRVTIIDCDHKGDQPGHASAFGAKGKVPGLAVIGEYERVIDGRPHREPIGEGNLLDVLKAERSKADLIILDLPGLTSRLTMMGMQSSHFVVIPLKLSLPDLRDALRTETQVVQAAELLMRPIHYGFLWSQVPQRFESATERAVREKLENREGGAPVFKPALMTSDAFAEMLVTGEPPQLKTDKRSRNAAANLAALADALLQQLAEAAERRVA